MSAPEWLEAIGPVPIVGTAVPWVCLAVGSHEVLARGVSPECARASACYFAPDLDHDQGFAYALRWLCDAAEFRLPWTVADAGALALGGSPVTDADRLALARACAEVVRGGS